MFVCCVLCRCDPYDAAGFKAWAVRAECPAIPQMLSLFNKLVYIGFKVILITGRDEETLGDSTSHNLNYQGFIGYERLILRCTYTLSHEFYLIHHSFKTITLFSWDPKSNF